MQDEPNLQRRIKTNKIRCKFCEDVIESKYTHDFQMGSCGVDASQMADTIIFGEDFPLI